MYIIHYYYLVHIYYLVYIYLYRYRIKKLWSIYMTETDSPLKINKIGFFIELQMNLEPVIHQSN